MRSDAQVSVAKDSSSGRLWTSDVNFVSTGSKPYEATLRYSEGIVEKELNIGDVGRIAFAQMLDLLRSSGDPYPLRPLHIGQALILATYTPNQPALLKSVQSASEFDLVTNMPIAVYFSCGYFCG